jgi:hypothetical protein
VQAELSRSVRSGVELPVRRLVQPAQAQQRRVLRDRHGESDCCLMATRPGERAMYGMYMSHSAQAQNAHVTSCLTMMTRAHRCQEGLEARLQAARQRQQLQHAALAAERVQRVLEERGALGHEEVAPRARGLLVGLQRGAPRLDAGAAVCSW